MRVFGMKILVHSWFTAIILVILSDPVVMANPAYQMPTLTIAFKSSDESPIGGVRAEVQIRNWQYGNTYTMTDGDEQAVTSSGGQITYESRLVTDTFDESNRRFHPTVMLGVYSIPVQFDFSSVYTPPAQLTCHTLTSNIGPYPSPNATHWHCSGVSDEDFIFHYYGTDAAIKRASSRGINCTPGVSAAEILLRKEQDLESCRNIVVQRENLFKDSYLNITGFSWVNPTDRP
jgi:hypothetical protein